MRKATRRAVEGIWVVVVAAVLILLLLLFLLALYVLTSGYISGGAPAPSTLGFTDTGFFRNAHVTDINFTVSASSGLKTGQVGFKLLLSDGAGVPLGIVGSNTKAGCTEGNPFGGCGPGNGTYGSWYLVMTDSSAIVMAVYDASGWIFGNTTTFDDSYTLTVVSAVSYIGSGDDLEAFGLGSGSVSGSTTL